MIQHQRIKYACPCCDGNIKVTPAAPRIISRGLLSDAVLAWMVTAKSQTKSYLWAQMNGTGPPVRLFGYSPGRGTGHALKLYAGMAKGALLMTDGYDVDNAIAATHDLAHLGCRGHCRRSFIEAEDVVPKQACTPDQPATQFIAAIGKLYAAEARARQADAKHRQRLRAW